MILNKKEPINVASLIVSLVTLVLGIILIFNGNDEVYKLIGYIVSGILIVAGIIRLLIARHTSKKTGSTEIGTIITSVLLIVLGILIAVFPKSIMITFSLCVGALMAFAGVRRLVLGIAVRKVDQKGSKFFIIESILIILVGVLILSQQLFSLIGIFLVVYAVSELVGYVYYKSQNKDYSEVLLNKEITREMIETEAKEAIIEDEKEDEE